MVGILYLLLAFALTPFQITLVVLLQSLASSLILPNYSALQGEMVPQERRGLIFGRISTWAGFASLLGTLPALLIVINADPHSSEPYRWLFVVAMKAGVLAGVSVWRIKEKKSIRPPLPKTEEDLRRRKDFRFFVEVQSLYNFFMSMIWPLMAVTTVSVLGVTNLDIVLLTVILSLATFVVQTQIGRVMDRVGPVSLISVSRFMFVVVPIVYGLAWSIYTSTS